MDASVVAKWFNRGETNEKEARVLRDSWLANEVSLFAPSLILYEVSNTILKNPGVPTPIARDLVRAVVKLSPHLLIPSDMVAEEAMRIARKERLTFYDAAYLAIAKSLACRLITADEEQLSAARGYLDAEHLSEFRRKDER